MLSLFLGLDPVGALGNDARPLDEDTAAALDEARKEYARFLQQFSNYGNVNTLSNAEAQQQYTGMLKILAKSSDPAFQTYSREKKIEVLQRLKPFENKEAIKKKQYDDLYKAIYAGAIVSGAVFVSTKGVVGAVTTLAGVTLKLAPWMKKTGKLIGGVTKIYGGYKLLKGAFNNDALQAAESIKLGISDRYFNSAQFRFETALPNFQLNANSTADGAIQTFDESKISDPVVRDMYAFIKRELGSPSILGDQARLEVFLEKYTQRVGDVQLASIKKLIEANEKSDSQAIAEQRDQAALFQSIQNFVGSVVISSMAAPKEAEILNTLLSAGFQVALGGAMGPMGWAAVGISLAGSLMKKSGPGFEKALFEALKQIQRQLTEISNKIDVLYRNQVVIISQLNAIIARMDKAEDLIVTKFAGIAQKQDLIYDALIVMRQQDLETRIADAYSNLDSAILDNSWEVVYNNLLELRNIATNALAGYANTKFKKSSFSTPSLMAEIFIGKTYKYNISLYDSIGLLSALSSYNPGTKTGTCDVPIVHPLDFCALSSDTVDWLVLANISSNRKKDIAAKLLATANDSQLAINRFAAKTLIEDKAAEFLASGSRLLLALQTKAYEIEKAAFTDNKDVLIKQFELNCWTNPNLGGLVDASIKDNNQAANFYDDHNDSRIYNLMFSLNILKEIKHISQVDFTKKIFIGQYYSNQAPPQAPAVKRGYVVGSKSRALVFENLLVDFESGLTIDLEIQYDRFLRMHTFTDEAVIGSGGSYGSTPLCKAYRKVTKTYSTGETNDTWKEKLKQALVARGVDKKSALYQEITDLSLYDFLTHLIGQDFRRRKSEYVAMLIKSIEEDVNADFDGTGVSLMVLSKLNQLVTNSVPSPYLLDYNQEMFIRDDMVDSLNSVVGIDFEKLGRPTLRAFIGGAYRSEVPNEKPMSYFLIQTGHDTYSERLDPFRFMDLCLIVLNKKLKDTYRGCLAQATALDDQSGEPHLKASIAKLRWFLDAYLA